MNGLRGAVLLIVLAALALGTAVPVASATSPAWIVAGKTLAPGATKALAETTTVTEIFTIKTSQWGVKCPSIKLFGSLIEGENIRKDNAMTLEGCEAIGAPTCKVPPIKLKPLTSTLEGTAGHFKLNFKPTSGTTVMAVNLSGSGCGGFGTLTVTGTMACNYPGVETEAQNHVLEFSLTSGTALKFGEEEVTLTGQDEFWLSSKESWGVA